MFLPGVQGFLWTGVVKINCDASFEITSDIAGVVVVVRDFTRAIIGGGLDCFKAFLASLAEAAPIRKHLETKQLRQDYYLTSIANIKSNIAVVLPHLSVGSFVTNTVDDDSFDDSDNEILTDKFDLDLSQKSWI
ncbi:hypothetical protein V6N12_054226 [Hibiscus sabdariffa]|uniref:RNase H type-1 domain-containing protein n=1 Tax=Hibiscus sabdariffa TaxID=183260 RepID=A0ABR2CZT4_9ROSI